MPRHLFADWLAARRSRRAAAVYAAALQREPDERDVDWVAAAVTRGDADRARWELRYARRALGVVVSQRDALDDRTGSLVARRVAELMRRDQRVAPERVHTAERQLWQRFRLYRDALEQRAAHGGTVARLGRALLAASGADDPLPTDADRAARAGAILALYLAESNDALRRAFGDVALPEDVPPSEAVGSR